MDGPPGEILQAGHRDSARYLDVQARRGTLPGKKSAGVLTLKVIPCSSLRPGWRDATLRLPVWSRLGKVRLFCPGISSLFSSPHASGLA